jgi:hypothetical protein
MNVSHAFRIFINISIFFFLKKKKQKRIYIRNDIETSHTHIIFKFTITFMKLTMNLKNLKLNYTEIYVYMTIYINKSERYKIHNTSNEPNLYG